MYLIKLEIGKMFQYEYHFDEFYRFTHCRELDDFITANCVGQTKVRWIDTLEVIKWMVQNGMQWRRIFDQVKVKFRVRRVFSVYMGN